VLELSTEARLAMLVIEIAPGGSAVVTVTATGPAPAEAQTVFAVACWVGETASLSAWRVAFVTASR
jgi:hypothetical protein